MNKPIGILGGTFDPIHYGHLRIALELQQDYSFEEIRFIPCKQPVHKDDTYATTQQRCHMIELAIKNQKNFILDKRELERETPSYMILTLESLRKDFKDTPLCLIVGTDAYKNLMTWFRWNEILSLCHIVVVSRPNVILSHEEALTELLHEHWIYEKESLLKKTAGYIYSAPLTMLDISSTAIRQMIQSKNSPRYLIPDSVLEYIEHEKIYI
ncbi:MAG: nicotinate-nucleotide adenylyltransferase [Gammaproteobacteria bacterium]